MLNRWLLYQTLACRVWARAAFYQSGGAYGFRDQLQDVMALTVARARSSRASTSCAPRPGSSWRATSSTGGIRRPGAGVRTRISDDLLWLPYAVAHYVEVTGDAAVLDEVVPFLDGPAARAGAGRRVLPARRSPRSAATLFEHCARALDRSLAVGAHGLPLMGTGDWNDGMNRVGAEGRGRERLARVVSAHDAVGVRAAGRGARRARARRDMARARGARSRPRSSSTAWDGDWYRRAYFDDGTPLGSAGNAECRIDSIAQSWAVHLGRRRAGAGGAGDGRRRGAPRAARRQELVAAVHAALRRTRADPGYIKGYPPGIRENGGQYTHAALWSVMAFAALGDGDKAERALLDPEPDQPREHARGRPPLQGRALRRGGRRLCGAAARRARRMDLVHRLRGLDVPRRHRVASRASACGARSCSIDPCIPRAWRGFEIAFRYHASATRSSCRIRAACRAASRAWRSMARRLPSGSATVPLTDDGATHRIRVVLG